MDRERIPLSGRELEIMRLVATGATNRQIARDLHISVNTVKVHLRNVFEKLSVQSRTEATMSLVHAGLITVEGISAQNEPVAQGGIEELPATPEDSTAESRRRPWNIRTAWAAFALLAFMATVIIWAQVQMRILPPPVTEATATAVSSRWKAGPPLPDTRFGLGVVAYRGKIYAVGGLTAFMPAQGAASASDAEVTGRSMVMDVNTMAWSALPDKPTPVGNARAAVLAGKIVVPGGRLADGTITTTVEAFDPVTETWKRMPALPAPRSRYALASLEGKLILFGGWDGHTVQSSVLEYDTNAGHWTELSSMPVARADMASAIVEDAVYLLGGTDGQDALSQATVYLANAAGSGLGSWDTIQDLPEPRAGASAVSIARGIYLIGGGDNLPPIRYDPATQKWTPLEPLIDSPWYDMGVTSVGNKLYVIGGRMEEPLANSWAYIALYQYYLPQGAFGP